MISKFSSKLANLKKEEGGFTLIELMIVVAIIGILAAIAIPQFAAYRQKAYDSAAKADLSNLATEMENYYLDNSTYPSSAPTTFSSSTSITISIVSTSATGFTATAAHAGSQNTFTYDSTSGGIQ